MKNYVKSDVSLIGVFDDNNTLIVTLDSIKEEKIIILPNKRYIFIKEAVTNVILEEHLRLKQFKFEGILKLKSIAKLTDTGMVFEYIEKYGVKFIKYTKKIKCSELEDVEIVFEITKDYN